jgi:microcompartment protein CcmK/EutM
MTTPQPVKRDSQATEGDRIGDGGGEIVLTDKGREAVAEHREQNRQEGIDQEPTWPDGTPRTT